LDSLPWAKDGENVPFYEADPMGYSPSMSRSGNPTTSSRLSFPEVSEKQKNQRKQTSPSQFDPTEQKTQEQPLPSTAPPLVEGESAAWVVRTALCVQAREGKLYLFHATDQKSGRLVRPGEGNRSNLYQN
jgi:hypothetical protein